MLRPILSEFTLSKHAIPVFNAAGTGIDVVDLPPGASLDGDDGFMAVFPEDDSLRSWMVLDKTGKLYKQQATGPYYLLTGDSGNEERQSKRARDTKNEATLVTEFKQKPLVSSVDSRRHHAVVVFEGLTSVCLIDKSVRPLRSIPKEIYEEGISAVCLAILFDDDILIGTQRGNVYNLSKGNAAILHRPIPVTAIVSFSRAALLLWKDGCLTLLSADGNSKTFPSIDAEIVHLLKITDLEAVGQTRRGGLCRIRISDERLEMNIDMLVISRPLKRLHSVDDQRRLLTLSYDGTWSIHALQEEVQTRYNGSLRHLLDRLDQVSNDGGIQKKMKEQNQQARMLQAALALKLERVRCTVSAVRNNKTLAFRIRLSLGESEMPPTTVKVVIKFTVHGQSQEIVSKALETNTEADIVPVCYANANKYTKMLPIEVEVTSYAKGTCLSKVCFLKTFDAFDTGVLDCSDEPIMPLNQFFPVSRFSREIWPAAIKEGLQASDALKELIPCHLQVETHTPLRASLSTRLSRITLTFDGRNAELSITTSEPFTAAILHHALLTRLTKVASEDPCVPRIKLQAKRRLAELNCLVEGLDRQEDPDPIELSESVREALKQAIATWEVIRKTVSFEEDV